jgi:transcriptional regulator with XRE-family HTH domain
MSWFFGQYLERLLAKKGWKQGRLAAEADLSRPYIKKIVEGEDKRYNKPPNISEAALKKLASALGVSVLDLSLAKMGYDPEKPREEGEVKKIMIEYARTQAALTMKEFDFSSALDEIKELRDLFETGSIEKPVLIKRLSVMLEKYDSNPDAQKKIRNIILPSSTK